MDFVFVDLQGFKNQFNDFIVKEIYILSKNFKFHEIIKSPHSYEILSTSEKIQVNWLRDNYHGLSWNDGYITVSELQNTIIPILRGKIILVKGLEKVSWLKSICRGAEMRIINLENTGCNLQLHKAFDEMEGNEKVCSRHKKIKSNIAHCAVKNVWMMKKWFYHFFLNMNVNEIKKQLKVIE